MKPFAVALFLMSDHPDHSIQQLRIRPLQILSAITHVDLAASCSACSIIGRPFGIVMSGIQVIALAGIVVNNNIVLLDIHDRLRKQISDPTSTDPVRNGALAPAARPADDGNDDPRNDPRSYCSSISTSSAARYEWAHLRPNGGCLIDSATIVAGLTFSTVLTLIITPSALMARENVAAWLQRKREAADGGGAPAPAE